MAEPILKISKSKTVRELFIVLQAERLFFQSKLTKRPAFVNRLLTLENDGVDKIEANHYNPR